jgi:hypothetical protein
MNASPTPTEEEAAAIVAALEALWPRPAVAVPEPTRQPSAWRFSGRWWALPLPLRRERPYF